MKIQMKIQMKLKGLRLGKIVITTMNQLQNANIDVWIDPQNIWNLFKKAVKKGRIVFPK